MISLVFSCWRWSDCCLFSLPIAIAFNSSSFKLSSALSRMKIDMLFWWSTFLSCLWSTAMRN